MHPYTRILPAEQVIFPQKEDFDLIETKMKENR